jgi:HEAT repeat protein
MKLRRKHAWLLTAPLAWLAGCGSGPISGLTSREPVVSLERPDPLVSLKRSLAVEAADADAGAFKTADWQPGNSDAENQRMFLLSSARRRMSQQQMMMQMMTPMMQPVAPPTHHVQSGSPSAPTRSSTTKTTAKPAAPAAAFTPQMLMPGMLPLEGMPPTGLAARRAARTQRTEQREEREETAATVEADRIERAAAAEAERAEKAAQAEATIAERQLMAEAELVERMTRAETELAERLAAAKDERDRRIALARSERELRMAIIGIDAAELETNTVDEAISKLQKPHSGDSSGLTRFTRFFRGRGESPTDSLATSVAAAKRPSAPAEEFPAPSGDPSQDLIDRTLNHSHGLLDQPSIAEFASNIPNVDRPADAVAAAPAARTAAGPRSSLLDDAAGVDDYDSLLSREAIARADNSEPENWSLLGDFPLDSGSEPNTAPPAEEPTAGDFPLIASTEPAPAPDFEPPAATPGAPVIADAGQSRPEDDVWILGGDRHLAGFDDHAPAGAGSTQPASADAFPTDSFSELGGLYARAELSTSAPSPVQEFPAAETSSAPTSDPWLESSIAATAPPAEERDVPQFDWSGPQSTSSNGLAAVVHQQVPSAQEEVRNAAYSAQSLRDACGPLPADLEALVLQLDIPEAGVRKEVLADLARLGPKARPALPAIRCLLDDSPIVAAHAAWTLWEIEQNESQTVNELVRLLHTGNIEVVQFTAYALGSLGPKALDAAPALRTERERFSGATRIHVAEALTRIDAFDQASVEVLITSLQHPETHVRWMAALALGQTQARYADLAVPALVGALHDQDPEVRSAAALSIGGFGSAATSAIPELQSRATLDSPSVREAAQTALACIRKL